MHVFAWPESDLASQSEELNAVYTTKETQRMRSIFLAIHCMILTILKIRANISHLQSFA